MEKEALDLHIFGMSIGDITGILSIIGTALFTFSWIFKKLVIDPFSNSIGALRKSINGLQESITTMNKKHEKEIKEITDDLNDHTLMIQGLDKDMERIFEETEKNRHSVIK